MHDGVAPVVRRARLDVTTAMRFVWTSLSYIAAGRPLTAHGCGAGGVLADRHAGGCAALDPSAHADALAEPAGLRRELIDTSGFVLTAFSRISQPGKPIHVATETF
jgi:hypothetical protein